MGRKPNYYNQIINTLHELHTLYPSFNMGKHLATALSEYTDFWGISDKEMLYTLERYKATLEYNETPIASQEDIDKIVEDGMNLQDILEEEEEENG